MPGAARPARVSSSSGTQPCTTDGGGNCAAGRHQRHEFDQLARGRGERRERALEQALAGAGRQRFRADVDDDGAVGGAAVLVVPGAGRDEAGAQRVEHALPSFDVEQQRAAQRQHQLAEVVAVGRAGWP
jgi:hypothetical protein